MASFISTVISTAGTAAAQGQLEWVPAKVLQARSSHAMAYDAARRCVVLFGGQSATTLSETWERDGNGWSLRAPNNRPPARGYHAMAYDAARGRVVLFGGFNVNGSALFSDTWEWDGNDWTLRTPNNRPSARGSHAMAYDAARGRVVLFGGFNYNSNASFSDTWEWDGKDWSLRTPTNRPSARASQTMVYDAVRGRVVLFGGEDSSGSFSDTWEWDGKDWTLRTSNNRPAARSSHAMAYDDARGRVVLFGGAGNAWRIPDTWEWDGKDWTLRNPNNRPSPRALHAMAYDAARGRVVLFGGDDQTSLRNVSDTWEWDGTNWTLSTPQSGPTSRSGHAMAFDSAGRALLFGGENSASLSDTWEWDGVGWELRAPKNAPPARSYHAMAKDTSGRTVLFGGSSVAGYLSDTWAWDGSDWTRRTPINSPPLRYRHAMAYDVARRRIVLFGGDNSSSTLGDTWEWDGNNWILRTPNNSPPARHSHAMAYDIVRRRVVLFGGVNFANNRWFSDTWEWDGNDWSLRTPNNAPSARIRHAMTYDLARVRTVLYGGERLTNEFSDTWEWDGNDWTLRTTNNSPLPGSSHAMTYDQARGYVVLFGRGETWLRTSHTAATRTAGTGCSGSATPPVLTSRIPNLGNQAFKLELIGAPPTSPCVFGLSAGTQVRPIPPCTLYLSDPILTLSALTNTSGVAGSPAFAIPAAASLRGLKLYAQAVVADPQGPALGVSFSAGLSLEIGD